MRKRILALDIGEKRIGVALSDELGITAQGQPTIEVKSFNIVVEQIQLLLNKYNVDRIVIGLPKNMDGTLGPKSEEIIKFEKMLRSYIDVPVVLWDERLTTRMAEQSMLEGDLSRAKRKRRIDMISAQLILQSYLDSEQSKNENDKSKES